MWEGNGKPRSATVSCLYAWHVFGFKIYGAAARNGYGQREYGWVLWIAGVMQVFPIYYWWQYDHITLYVGLSAIQPAPVCILFHILFAACTLGLLLGQRKYR